MIALGIFEEWCEVTAFVTFLEQVLTGCGYKMNKPKTEIIVLTGGAGSRKLDKEVKNKTTGVKCGDMPVHPSDIVKYLGVMLSATGRSGAATDARVRAANTAHHRLAPKVFRKGSLPLRLRIQMWVALVRSVALYAMEVFVLSEGSLTQLERWQAQKLRNVSKAPAHISGLTNEQVRRNCKVFSVQSDLRFRRMLWWRNLLMPALAPAADDADAPRAVRACLLGRLSFETHAAGETDRQRQLLEDIVALNESLAELGFEQACCPVVLESLSPTVLAWFIGLSRAELASVRSYRSEVEEKKKAYQNKKSLSVHEEFKCAQCGLQFHNKRALNIHIGRQHKDHQTGEAPSSNPSLKCANCGKEFTRIDVLKRHVQSRCAVAKAGAKGTGKKRGSR